MTKSKFDAIVIGAGMSGNAAAYSMASRGLKVLQLERGEHSGSKNVQGAILYANMQKLQVVSSPNHDQSCAILLRILVGLPVRQSSG